MYDSNPLFFWIMFPFGVAFMLWAFAPTKEYRMAKNRCIIAHIEHINVEKRCDLLLKEAYPDGVPINFGVNP